jgi:hypothetical protein
MSHLGMYLDCHLNWKQHSENLVKKLNTACFNALFVVSEQVLRMVCFSHNQLQLNMLLFFGALPHQ